MRVRGSVRAPKREFRDQDYDEADRGSATETPRFFRCRLLQWQSDRGRTEPPVLRRSGSGRVADGLVGAPTPGLRVTITIQKKTRRLRFQSQWIQVGR